MKFSFEQLNSALKRREQAGAPLQIFFRDDDVDEDEATLRRLLGLFQRQKIPVNLGVIPGLLTEAGGELLAQTFDNSPDLVEMNQHGWRHINHEPEGRKCEFGPSRTYADQLADIERGQERMTAVFGERWRPVFIPPWNRCSEDAYRAIDHLGFCALSAKQGASVVTGYRFQEISITLDLYRWKNGPSLKPPEEIVHEIVDQSLKRQRIGVMTHHKVMDEGAFDFLDSLLGALAQSPIVRFHTFQSLALLNDGPQRV